MHTDTGDLPANRNNICQILESEFVSRFVEGLFNSHSESILTHLRFIMAISYHLPEKLCFQVHLYTSYKWGYNPTSRSFITPLIAGSGAHPEADPHHQLFSHGLLQALKLRLNPFVVHGLRTNQPRGTKQNQGFSQLKGFPNGWWKKNVKNLDIDDIDLWNGPPTNGYLNSKYEHFFSSEIFGNQNFWGTHLCVFHTSLAVMRSDFLGGFKFQPVCR